MTDAHTKRLFAVINPVAGSCDAATVQDALHRACTSVGLDCECYLTTGDDDISAIVRQAIEHGCCRVVAAGGDGTVAAVASVVAEYPVPLAVLPVGTANLLAREMGIPLELEAACELAVNGQYRRRLDAMKIRQQLFFSHVSLGVYSKSAEKTSPAAKRYFRRIAYIWNALPELLGKRSWRFTLTIDGQTSHPRASFIMIANVGGLGAGDLRWGPEIEPDDGEVDICIVHARSLWDYAVLGWHVLSHRHREAPKLTYLRARQNVQIKTRKRVPVRGDGEIVGQSTLDLTILPQAIAVIAAAASAAEAA